MWVCIDNCLLRLAGSPEKIKFLKDGMNIIDVLAIMPFFVSLFFLGSTEKRYGFRKAIAEPSSKEKKLNKNRKWSRDADFNDSWISFN